MWFARKFRTVSGARILFLWDRATLSFPYTKACGESIRDCSSQGIQTHTRANHHFLLISCSRCIFILLHVCPLFHTCRCKCVRVFILVQVCLHTRGPLPVFLLFMSTVNYMPLSTCNNEKDALVKSFELFKISGPRHRTPTSLNV